MTVIMALKREGEVWLGSDTRITEGDYKLDYPISGDMDSKLLFLENAVIGASGMVTIRNYLELFLTKGKNAQHSFESKLKVIEFFLSFKRFLKKEGLIEGAGPIEAQWLVATPTQIFTVDQDGAVLEYPEMCIIGSGTYSARAVLEYMIAYQPSLSATRMLERAHDITLRHNLSCGGKQMVMNVTKELSEKPEE
jgi:ATP-dependent protease HslVU (ClpYQ) peptidase subunit